MGLGEELPDYNPFCQLQLPAFATLAKNQQWTQSVLPVQQPGHVFLPVDACLSVEGLPQSGTGQATLFTGVNCAKLAKKHFGPYPHSTSKPVIASNNVFSQVNQLFTAHPAPNAFANAYPERFFNYAAAKNRWSVTTLACIEAGLPICKEKDLRNGNALAADITGKAWSEKLNIEISPIEEKEAARRLVEISSRHPFTLFEYYLTDKAGHGREMKRASEVLHSLDRFFDGILQSIDLSQTLLVVTSDHGNLENLSTKSHTTNPVPFIALGKGASSFKQIGSIRDVTPTIAETLRSFNSTSMGAD